MPRATVPRASLEPTIMRLQLALAIGRREAEACVKAGFASAAEVAAADDGEFHREVRLAPEARARVLAAARAPGSKHPAAGKAPHLARDRRPVEKVANLARPVFETVVKLAGAPQAPAPAARAAKQAPPHEADEKRRARRTAASELEADLDEALVNDD
jgi:hypothetical protein